MKNRAPIINNLAKGEVVIYTRPWFSNYYSELALAVSGEMGCQVSFLSDYSVPGSYDLRKSAVCFYDAQVGCVVNNDIYEYVNDIISRDRLLRKIERSEAVKRVNSYYDAVKEFFSERNVVCFISATVDQYVVDIIYLYCLNNNIPFIGYHISVIPDYTLFTARGEIYNYRSGQESEVNKAIARISCSDFRPAYVPGLSNLKVVGLKRYIKNIIRHVYYRALSFQRHSKLNYHIETSIVESRRHLSFAVLQALAWGYDRIPIDKFLYLPLQFHPECNTEYWDRDNSYEDYEEKVLRFLKNNSATWKVVLKEHPNMVGLRLGTFYHRAKSNGGIIVDHETDHKSLLKRCYAVVTMNSSAGIEALCEGKVVVCLSVPYYKSNYHIIKTIDQTVHDTEIEEVVRKCSATDALRVTISKIINASMPIALCDINLKPSELSAMLAKQSADLFSKQIRPLIQNIEVNREYPNDVYTIR